MIYIIGTLVFFTALWNFTLMENVSDIFGKIMFGVTTVLLLIFELQILGFNLW